MNKDNIQRQAFEALNSSAIQGLKEMVENMTIIAPSILEIAKNIENESMKQGFTESQSFDIAKGYVLSLLAGTNNN